MLIFTGAGATAMLAGAGLLEFNGFVWIVRPIIAPGFAAFEVLFEAAKIHNDTAYVILAIVFDLVFAWMLMLLATESVTRLVQRRKALK